MGIEPATSNIAVRYGAVAQWYSQRTSVLEVTGSIPTPVIVEMLDYALTKNQS